MNRNGKFCILNLHFPRPPRLHDFSSFYTSISYVIAKFFRGVSDQNENLVGKFFAQKRGSQGFFRRGGSENLQKTVKNR